MVETIWLHRPSRDGGIDYVCFRAQQGAVEILEGSHLPPQMPLIKTRISLGSAQARDRRDPGSEPESTPEAITTPSTQPSVSRQAFQRRSKPWNGIKTPEAHDENQGTVQSDHGDPGPGQNPESCLLYTSPSPRDS